MLDSHTAKAAEMFRVPYAEVTPRMRQYAKMWNHAERYTVRETFAEFFKRIGKELPPC